MNQNHAIPIPQHQHQQSQPQNILPSNPQQNQQQNQQPQNQQQNQIETPKSEEDDGANGGTTSIDTFQEYKPTALPSKVVRACNEWYTTSTSTSTTTSNSNSNHKNIVKAGKENNTASGKNDDEKTNSVIDLTEVETKTEAKIEVAIETEPTKDITTATISSTTTTTTALEVPSHTSSACESALLSSVAAPMVPYEVAECLLPLLLADGVGTPHSISKSSNDTETETETKTPPPPPPPLSPLQLEGVLLSIQRHRRIHHKANANANANGNAVPATTSTTTTRTAGAFRAGFFLGDGAGIGKGRQISAIIRDGFCRGRKRHVWLSVSRELIKDAKRDLNDVGLHCASDDCVHDGTNFLGDHGSSNKGLGRKDKGVLFLTYNLLVSANRIEQIIAWCVGTEYLGSSVGKNNKSRTIALQLEESFDGCLVFDEAHKAKNLADNTKTAQLVLMLQRRLPMARVVYCSATGVSEIDQLAYAERLGLWNVPLRGQQGQNALALQLQESIAADGNSDGSFANFGAFRRSLEKRGLGSLELLALELKTRGSFLARTLSWEGAEFKTVEVPLDREQRMIYDRSVSWWNKCKVDLKEALDLLGNMHVPANGNNNGNNNSNARQVWGIFWAAHQRFFKELAICAKVPFLAKDALKHIHEEGCCVVFGLQGTGEASMQSLLLAHSNNNNNEDEKKKQHPKSNRFHPNHNAEKCFPALMSTVAACLTNFVKQHFPVAPPPPDPPSLPKHPPTSDIERQRYATIQAEIDRIRGLPPPQPIPFLVQKQQLLLEAVRHMNLPPNPLDDLIDRLGGVDAVAEMTGRSGRIVRGKNKKENGGGDQFVYTKRVVASSSKNTSIPAIQRGEESDRINLIERRLFMDGTKSAAIISDAASTGVSLHAASGSGASHKRRVHYTIELPWSADKAVQQLGRTHRSGQKSAPIYKLVITNLGGERRFAAAVSKRLASLGALTKGDRRAATGSDMSEFDLDSKYGKRALRRFYRALEENEASAGESSAGVLGVLSSERGKAKTIIEDFVKDSIVARDPIVQSLPNDDEKMRNACVLSIAKAELDRIGLDKASRNKADVRVFLNRISGLMVSRQSLVFSLFMSTLGGVIKTAKTSGEFEGTAEDLAATAIEIGHETDLAVDPTSGAQTKLTTLVLDRGIPFETVRILAMEEVEKSSSTTPGLDDGKEDTPSTNEDNLDEFIVDDDSDDDNGHGTNRRIAESGFYISKNSIRGRFLVLFAKRKFDPSAFKTEEERAAVDPLGLMQVTRPNTGTNLTDKSTWDLRQTYRLTLSCDKIRELSSEEQGESIKENVFIKMSKKISSMWKLAFKESDSFKHENGLAPRRQRVSLVNGPVLHILPALENVVRFRSEKEKALKIMRAQVGSRRIVGVRFPSDDEALEKLLLELDTIRKARRNAGKTFTDEALAPICPKTMSWATTKRKTMKSFFKVTSASSTTNNTTTKKSSAKPPPSNNKGGKRTFSPSLSSAKKPKTAMTMTSYFAKKK